MICRVSASVSPIARMWAPSVTPVFTANNDVLTQDWGPANAKCPGFGGPFYVITSASDGGKVHDDRWRKDVTVHGDKIFKARCLLVPKDMSERLVSQWHNSSTLHVGAQKL